eukprot:1155635-Pelagomonas_calceolata.AAC.6
MTLCRNRSRKCACAVQHAPQLLSTILRTDIRAVLNANIRAGRATGRDVRRGCARAVQHAPQLLPHPAAGDRHPACRPTPW